MGKVCALLNWFKLSSKIFLLTVPRRCFFVDHLCYFRLVLLCLHARLFVDAFWSPAGKVLTSWLSFVMSNCDVITFPLVSWVRRGALLYRFRSFPSVLLLSHKINLKQLPSKASYLTAIFRIILTHI